jgi:hypothetical protein
MDFAGFALRASGFDIQNGPYRDACACEGNQN